MDGRCSCVSSRRASGGPDGGCRRAGRIAPARLGESASIGAALDSMRPGKETGHRPRRRSSATTSGPIVVALAVARPPPARPRRRRGAPDRRPRRPASSALTRGSDERSLEAILEAPPRPASTRSSATSTRVEARTAVLERDLKLAVLAGRARPLQPVRGHRRQPELRPRPPRRPRRRLRREQPPRPERDPHLRQGGRRREGRGRPLGRGGAGAPASRRHPSPGPPADARGVRASRGGTPGADPAPMDRPAPDPSRRPAAPAAAASIVPGAAVKRPRSRRGPAIARPDPGLGGLRAAGRRDGRRASRGSRRSSAG